MKTDQIKSANNSLPGYYGSDTIYKNGNGLHYTLGIKDIATATKSYWFLDVIASYQSELTTEGFQVWKLLRVLTTDSSEEFIVFCEDGNENILIQQKIDYSDFIYDHYEIWCIDKTLILPIEY